jgi:hypothetical protein
MRKFGVKIELQKSTPKGVHFNMHLHSKVTERIELEDGIFSQDEVIEGLHIEEILHRAHQIHRAHGGLIGYDLEDWLEAEHELFEKNRSEHFQPEETVHKDPLPSFLSLIHFIPRK